MQLLQCTGAAQAAARILATAAKGGTGAAQKNVQADGQNRVRRHHPTIRTDPGQF